MGLNPGLLVMFENQLIFISYIAVLRKRSTLANSGPIKCKCVTLANIDPNFTNFF